MPKLRDDQAIADRLGITLAELFARRSAVAQDLAQLGPPYVKAKKRADKVFAEGRDPLVAKVIEAAQLGIGPETIAQCTGGRELSPDGKRGRGPYPDGVITQATTRRWVEAAGVPLGDQPDEPAIA